jgi:glutaredoxin
MRTNHLLASILLFVSLACASQIVYLGRNADGSITTSSQPPADYKPVPFTPLPPKSAQTATPNQSSARVPSPTTGRSRAAMAPQGLVLYAADWCPYCRQARQYLKSQGIAYTEINIDTQDGSQAFAAAVGNGRKGIPLMVSGQRQIRGFNVASYDAFFSAKQ